MNQLKHLKTFSLRAALVLLVMMLTATTARAQETKQDGNWTYKDNGTYAIISAYTGSDKTTLTSLNFPKLLGGLPVMGISWDFYFSEFTNLQTLNFYRNAQIDEMPSVMNCSKLAHINVINDDGSSYGTDGIPESIHNIPGNCFRGTPIQVVAFGTVLSMGSNVFKDSNSLSNVQLLIHPTGSIGDGAFSYIQSTCKIITMLNSRSEWTWQKIAFSPNLYVICSDGGIGWCGDGGVSAQDFLYWTADASGNLTIACAGDGWFNFQDKQTIKSHRWNDWASFLGKTISSITLSQVYALGANEFKGMTGVTSVTLNDGLTSIGASAFEGCTGLTSITIPASVTSIGADAFKGCTSLTTVTIEGNPAIGAGAFPAGATVRMNLTANTAEEAKWTTFYNNGGNFEADANTTVYKGTVSSSNLMLTEVEDKIVNSSTAVILKSTGNPVMTLTTTESSDTHDNALQGVDVATATSTLGEGTFYVLGKVGNNFGFHRYTGTTMPARKAYLLLSGNAAPSLSMVWGDEKTTGIRPIENGELRMENSTDAWYTLDGQRLSAKPSTRGLYIHNGRKEVVK